MPVPTNSKLAKASATFRRACEIFSKACVDARFARVVGLKDVMKVSKMSGFLKAKRSFKAL